MRPLSDTNSKPNPNPNTHPNTHPKPNPKPNPNPNTHPNRNTHPNTHPNTNPKPNPNTNTHPNTHPKPNPKPNPNPNPNSNTHPNPNTHPNTHPNTNPKPNPNTNTSPNNHHNPNQHSNTHPTPMPNSQSNPNPGRSQNSTVSSIVDFTVAKSRGVAQTFRLFAGSTTAHGFRHLNDPLRALQIAWVLLITAAFVAFTVHMALLAVKFYDQPITTKISPKGSRYVAPDITVCSRMMFAISRLFNDSGKIEISHSFRPIYDSVQKVRKILNGSVRRFLLDTYGDYEFDTDMLRAEDDGVYNLPNLVIRDTYGIRLLAEFSANPSSMLLWCAYGMLACDRADFQPAALPASPACMTFSRARFRSRRPNITVNELNELRLVLFTDSFNSDPSVAAGLANLPGDWFNMQSSGGAVAYVHQPGTYPTHGNRIEASNGEETIVDIRYQAFNAKNTQRAPCLGEGSQEQLQYLVIENRQLVPATFKAHLSDCHVAVSQTVLLDRCGFIDPSLPVRADLADKPRRGNLSNLLPATASSTGQSLSPSQLIDAVYSQAFGSNSSGRANMPDMIRRLLENESCLRLARVAAAADPRIGQCLDFCRGGMYTTGFMAAAWPVSVDNFLQPLVKRWLESNAYFLNGSSKTNASVNEAFIRSVSWNLLRTYKSFTSLDLAAKNFLAMRFRPADAQGLGTLTEESWAYELQDLASDIGGILGLYMGVSILTLFELFELLARIGFIGYCNRRAEAAMAAHFALRPQI